MTKRILVVSQHYWPENFRITDICEAFVQRGIEVDVLCGLPNYPKGEFFDGYGWKGPFQEERGGVHIYRCREIPRQGNTKSRIFWNYVSFPFFARFQIGRFKKKRYDAIFSYETSPVMMAYPAIRLAQKTGVPCTVYVLDQWPENLYSVFPVKNRFLRKAVQIVSDWHYRKADRLIALSPQARTHLAKVTGKPPEKIAVIPQYCEDFYAQRPEVPEDIRALFGCGLTVLFAGNISPAQSLETLVLAAKKAQAKMPDAIRYVIVGDGMSRSDLEHFCAQQHVAHLFTFTGQKKAEEIPAYQAAAGALFAGLNRSDMLGFTIPAKIASYCAAGRPILASMDGAGADVVRQAECGFASPAEDADKLADNLLALAVASPEERARMGDAGFAYYQAHFRRDAILDDLESFLFTSKGILP